MPALMAHDTPPSKFDHAFVAELIKLTESGQLTWSEHRKDWVFTLTAPAGDVAIIAREPAVDCGGWLELNHPADKVMSRQICFPAADPGFGRLLALIVRGNATRTRLNDLIVAWRDSPGN